MNLKNSIASVFLALAAASCSSPTASTGNILQENGPSRAYHSSYNVPSHGIALEGYCPVAYFAVNKPVRGKAEHASIHKGITYHLVSAEAKAAFDEDPEKYVPAYGGWCAYGMSVEDKFPVDPRNFKIVDGRLMVFLKNSGVDARALWNGGDEERLVSKANAHWKKVKG